MSHVHKPCFIYAIAASKDGRPVSPVKVGISASPFVRLAELQTGSPVPLMLVGMLLAPHRSVALGAEQDFHANYPHQRLHGEWFDLPPYYVVGDLGHFLGDRIGIFYGHVPTPAKQDGGAE